MLQFPLDDVNGQEHFGKAEDRFKHHNSHHTRLRVIALASHHVQDPFKGVLYGQASTYISGLMRPFCRHQMTYTLARSLHDNRLGLHP